jgi:hypothetical protein
MVGKGSPRLNVMARSSLKLHKFVQATSAKKKPSPKCSIANRSGGSNNRMLFNFSSCFLVNLVLLKL